MKAELFKELVASVREGGAILRGEVTPSRKFVVNKTDVKRIRVSYRLSQGQFAALLGISVATLQNWEQGRRLPKGAAQVLLQVAAKHPETVWDVVKPVVAQSGTRSGTRIARAARAQDFESLTTHGREQTTAGSATQNSKHNGRGHSVFPPDYFSPRRLRSQGDFQFARRLSTRAGSQAGLRVPRARAGRH